MEDPINESISAAAVSRGFGHAFLSAIGDGVFQQVIAAAHTVELGIVELAIRPGDIIFDHGHVEISSFGQLQCG
jgi:hypothetical protein